MFRYTIKHDKMSSDFIWSLSAYALITIAGILLNILILKFYGNDYLGAFNQIYAMYVILSQLTVGGYHLSVQRYISDYSDDQKECSDILFSSIILTLAQSSIVVLILYQFKYVPGEILQSNIISQSFIYLLPALVFFSINKVLLAYFNSIREFKFFSLYISMRILLILLYLIAFYFLNIKLIFLPLIFFFTEITLFLFIIFNKYISNNKFILKNQSKWIHRHFKHGTKSFIGHFLLDLNTKVDTLLLGYFSTDYIVGVYSLASTLIDGISQIPYIFRNLYNPIITKLHFSKSKLLFKRIIKKSVQFNYKFFFFIWLLSSVLLPVLLYLFFSEYDIFNIYVCFFILNSGLLLSSGYIPFQMIFNQTGYPYTQTLFTILICFTNIILNIIFIPILGLYGAAFATAITFVLQSVYLKILTYTVLKFKI